MYQAKPSRQSSDYHWNDRLRKAGSSEQLGETTKRIFLHEASRRNTPCQHLALVEISGHQNGETIHLYCFKWLSLWKSVADMVACQLQVGPSNIPAVYLSPYIVLPFLGDPSYPLPTFSLSVWAALPKYFFFFFFGFFRDRVSLYSPGCPGAHFVDQAGLELRNPPASASRVLGLKAFATTPGPNYFLSRWHK